MMCCCNCNKGQAITMNFYSPEGVDEAENVKRAVSAVERYERERREALRGR
jgi:hypothetical protein